MDYRKFYEEKTGIKACKEEDIHHLDGNRKNNSIYNLVKIPSKLHKQYHCYLRIVEDGFKFVNNTSKEFQEAYSWEIKNWKKHKEKLNEKKNEINKYIKIRDCQLEVV